MAHGVPDAKELAEAVRGFLQHDVMPATDGRLQFLARVAGNVVAQLERELEHGAAFDAAHAERLARLGVADDRELAERIRDGSLDDRAAEVAAAVRERVADKLRIANPRHLEPEDREEP